MKRITVIVWASTCTRSYNKLLKKDPSFCEKFGAFLRDFCEHPNDVRFRLHKLKGILNDTYAIKVRHDLRLLFEIRGEEIFLVDIGKHDQEY